MLRTITYLLSLFIFLIPWQARFVLRAGELHGGFWEYGTAALYATDALFFAIIVLTLIAVAKKDFRFQILDFRFTFSFLIVIGYALFSIAWSLEKPAAFYAALKLFEGIALFLLIRALPINRTKLVWAFVASAVVQSLLAITQFFTQSVFAWPFSGIAAKTAADLGVAVVQFGDERWLRAYGSFPHPNLLGAFLAVALLFLFHLTLALSSKEREVKNYPLLLGEGRVRSRWLVVSCQLLVASGLFFTFSRAAWIATLFAICYWLFATHAWRERIVRQFGLLLMAYCVLLIILFFPLVKTRVVSSERLEVKSNIERVTGYREAVQLIKRHPFFGVGIGNYTAAVARELRPNNPSWSYQPVHNVFLLILSELGIVGFILLFFYLTLALSSKERVGVRSCVTRYSLLVTLAVLAMLDHSLWTLHSGILLAWLALSMDETVEKLFLSSPRYTQGRL